VDDWFRSNAACIVGNGKNIGFWKFKWYGNHTFKDLYPDLFAKEVVKDVMIADRLSLEGVNNTRMWQWIAPLSVLELQQLNNLIVLLAGFSLHPNRPDSWRWIPGSAGIFSVKSCYTLLLDKRQFVALDLEVLENLKKLWKNDVPSKVSVFGWRLLLERLPTREALHHRGILNNPHELLCVFCLCHTENCEHLFFSCSFIKGVWEAIFLWIGKSIASAGSVLGLNHFSMFGTLFRYPKGGRVNHLIWLATAWCVWNLRNQVVFNGTTPSANSLLEDIKTFSWLLFSGRYARNSCISFSAWCLDPMSTILSS
jgi:hypothetical protein